MDTTGAAAGERVTWGDSASASPQCAVGREWGVGKGFKLNIEILGKSLHARMYLCICVVCNLHVEKYLAIY